jgi:branched-chain amino acid transport system substrate-binding protein
MPNDRNDAATPLLAVITQKRTSYMRASPLNALPVVLVEGYLVGRAIIATLEKVNGEPTRKALVEAVQKAGTIDLGGFKLTYSDSSNRGSDHVFLTVIQADGSFKAVDHLDKPGT